MADRGDRRNIDDRAAALPRHHGNDVLHGKKGALEIDGEDAVPIRLRYVDHASHLGDADIVVEHVDAAIGLEACRDHRLDIAGAGDIGGEGGRLAAFGCDDLRGLFRGGAIAIDAKHLRALARKRHRGRLAIAPARPDRAGADHHRCLALEPFHRLLPSQFVIVRRRVIVVTLAPIGCPKISDSVRQFPSWHSRHSPAAPELPSTTSGIGARVGLPLKPAVDQPRLRRRLHAGAGALDPRLHQFEPLCGDAPVFLPVDFFDRVRPRQA